MRIIFLGLSQNLIFILSILMFNFIGLPPMLGFLLKILVIIYSKFFVILLRFLILNLFSSVVYLYLLTPLIVNLLVFKI